MIITETGNVGIGESNPQTSLDVADYAVIGNLPLGAQSTDQSTSLANGLGYMTSPWVYTNAIEAQGERGIQSTLITLGADGTYGSDDQIHFVTNGQSNMMVSSDGFVGIGLSAPVTDVHLKQSVSSASGTGGMTFEHHSSTGQWKTYHSGLHFSFAENGVLRSYIEAATGSYITTSDRSFKKDINSLAPTLGKVLRMNPVSYHYNDQAAKDELVIGFIAQEVQPLFPELVSEMEDGMLGMNYSATGVVAIKAIQEQQEIIDAQGNQIEQLQKQMQLLQEQLEALKKN